MGMFLVMWIFLDCHFGVTGIGSGSVMLWLLVFLLHYVAFGFSFGWPAGINFLGVVFQA